MSISLQKYSSSYFGKYLANPLINEICYNGENKIWFENANGIWESEDTNLNFEGAKAFAAAAASYKEDQIDKARPILSCILVNGERVQIVMPPATKKERISITIRKPSQRRFTIDDHEKSGLFENVEHKDNNAISPKDKELLELYNKGDYKNFIAKAVGFGKNVVICGETGSGKTTFMKSLIDFIPVDERIITIEDVEEIKFYEHKNFVQLFYPSEAKSVDFLNSATLLKSCLRMKPDRILLAELRGAETYDFINVLSSGHGGSITSCHAGSSKDAFKRLAMMILQNPQGQCVPFDIIQKMLTDLIDVIVHIYAHHGKRRISEIYFKEAHRE
ncbi:P-type DNA transfer ATPase VirB11 [Campylobacter sp. MIT 12-8780]|uniref:P-type DNA transfer ATPase VirB11 n=1 Tax=unclassified Campylobacter TaxID=2593542 RepID=UPI00115E7F3B|nr:MULTISPECIES: P-type DNA transfer ATPase VirB11 [unclassified Campylobacter]NDJ28065.1 P-type DNA transfer ATPase VirB11 [Campylobacter sp. MIT 19-121]TQR39969.1 P-type DNA transfer ATPase VirB11 [Campylobacter sp. MIT 12-8780]